MEILSQGSGTGARPDDEAQLVTPRMLRALLTGTTHLVLLMGPDGSMVDVAPSVTYLLGYTREELIGTSVIDLLPPEEREAAVGMLMQDVAAAGQEEAYAPDFQVPGEFLVRHRDGHYVWFELLRTNFIADPKVNGLLVVGSRIGHRHVLMDALSVLAFDPDGVAAMTRMTAYLNLEMPETRSAIRVDGRPERWVLADDVVAPLCHGPGPWDRASQTGEVVVAGVDDAEHVPADLALRAREMGFTACWCVPLPIMHPTAYVRFTPSPEQRFEIAATSDPQEDPNRLGCLVVWTTGPVVPSGAYLGTMERVGLFAEIALRRKRDRERIVTLLHHDPLTGALSRVGMREVIATSDLPHAYVLIDLDDFKLVNDQYGHSVGDELLRLARRRIASVVRRQDSIVRLGGDEFLVLVPGGDLDSVIPAARRLLAAFASPFRIGPAAISVGVSLGIAPPDPDTSSEAITDRADRAMYAAKQAGKNGWAVWRPDPDAPDGGRIEPGD